MEDEEIDESLGGNAAGLPHAGSLPMSGGTASSGEGAERALQAAMSAKKASHRAVDFVLACSQTDRSVHWTTTRH